MAAPPVLLVADDLAVIAAVKRVLAREGYECVLATNAADAVIAFGHSLPGLMLLQPSVESDRGGVVLEELQQHPDAALLRVVLLGETVPGFAWPVEPLPLDTEHFATVIAENIRTTESGGSWSVLETAPSASPPHKPEGGQEWDEWRATSPRPVEPGEAAAQEVPEPTAIDVDPTPPPPSRVPDALEEKLFGDLAADVEAQAMQSVESSLQLPADEELQRLEDDVRAEAQRRRQAREAAAVVVKPAPPTPPPPPFTAHAGGEEESFAELSEAPAPPPSRAAEVLARAEAMVLESRAQAEASQRADDADDRALREELAATLRRAEQAEAQLQETEAGRAALEEQLVSRTNRTAQVTAELNEAQARAAELEQALDTSNHELATSLARAEAQEQSLAAANAARAALEDQLAAREAKLEALAQSLQTAREDAEAALALAGEVEAEGQKRKELEGRLERAEAHLAEARAARDEAQAELLSLEQAREAEQQELKDAAARLEALQADLTSASELLEETARERDTLRAKAARLEPYEAMAEKVAAELAEEAQRRSGLEAELADTALALERTRAAAEDLEQSAERAEEKVKELEAREIMPLALPGKRTVGVARHGEVDLEGLARVVAQLVLGNGEARLELGVSGGARTLWFKRGQVIAAESNLEHEGLIARARRDGLIDARQEGELRLLRNAAPREQLEALKARGFIRDIESVPLVQRYTEQVALDAFTEEKTQYRLGEEPPGPAVLLATVPRPTLPMLAESLRRAVAPDELLERLGGGEAVPVATDSELDLRALGFSERERKMLTWVDGEATVEDLSLASGLKPDLAFRALRVAQLLGIVEVRPGTKRAEPAQGQLSLNRLDAKYDEVQDADYFTILGLSRAAGADEVRRAHQRLSQEFDPLRFSGHPDPGVQQRAQVVARLLEEAARALEDDHRRVEYARHLLD